MTQVPSCPPHGRPDKDHGFISCWLKGHKMPGSWSFYFLHSWNPLFSLASLTFLFFSLIVFIFISLSLNLFFWKISDLYSVSNPIGFFFKLLLTCYFSDVWKFQLSYTWDFCSQPSLGYLILNLLHRTYYQPLLHVFHHTFLQLTKKRLPFLQASHISG